MRMLTISVAESRFSKDMTRKSVSWEKLCARLSKPKPLGLTMAQYQALSRDDQLAKKDVGYYVGGWFEHDKRRKMELVGRDLIAFDIDEAAPGVEMIVRDALFPLAYVLHTTTKHAPDKPRLRALVPMSRSVTLDEYEPIARKLAERAGIDLFDHTTFQPARVMFWPGKTSDGDFWCEVAHGDWLDPDEVLAEYDDWTDVTQWPVGSKEGAIVASSVRVANPLEKPGIMGLFNRLYPITRVIDEFLADKYVSAGSDNRYTFLGGTSSGGATIQDNDTIMYSFHSHDPAAGHSVNAWDLVRIHKFGHLDEHIDDEFGIKQTRRPSFLAMERFASSLEDVADQLNPFDVLPDDEAPADAPWEDDGLGGPAPSPRAADAGLVLEGEELGDDGLPVSRKDSIKKERARSESDRYDDLMAAIQAIEATSALDLADKMLPQMAASGLSPLREGAVLNALIARMKDVEPGAKVSANDMRKTLRAYKDAVDTTPVGDLDLADVEYALAKQALSDHFGNGKHIMRFSKIFWIYRDGVWRKAEDEMIAANVQATLLKIKQDGDEDHNLAKLMALTKENGRDGYMNALTGAVASVVAKAVHKDAASDPMGLQRSIVPCVVNCSNGEVWVDTVTGDLKMKAHKAESLLTSKVNAAYDPDALCPTWDAAVQRVFRGCTQPAEMLRHFEEIMGYMIQPTRNIATWVLFKGPGSNGKSFLMKVIGELMGQNSYLSVSLADVMKGSDSHFTDQLFGKLMLLDDDYDKDTPLRDDWVKKLSELKKIDANPKYGQGYSLMSRAIMVLLSNHWPHTRDLSEGIRRRAQIFYIPTVITKAEQDPRHFPTIVQDELSGVMNRLLAGWQRVVRRGHRFDPPLECKAAMQDWLRSGNATARFMIERTDKVDSSVLASGKVLFAAYREWCVLEDQSAKPVGRNTFYDALSAMGYERVETRELTAFRGVALREPADPVFEDLDEDGL